MHSCEFVCGVGVGPQVLWACRDTLPWQGRLTSGAEHRQTNKAFLNVGSTDAPCERQKTRDDVMLTQSQVEAMCVLSYISGPRHGVNYWPKEHSANNVDNWREVFAAFAEEACQKGVSESVEERNAHGGQIEEHSLQLIPNVESCTISGTGIGLLGHKPPKYVSLCNCVCHATGWAKQKVQLLPGTLLGTWASLRQRLPLIKRWAAESFGSAFRQPAHVCSSWLRKHLCDFVCALRTRLSANRRLRKPQGSGKKLLQKGCRGAHAARLGALRRGAVAVSWAQVRARAKIKFGNQQNSFSTTISRIVCRFRMQWRSTFMLALDKVVQILGGVSRSRRLLSARPRRCGSVGRKCKTCVSSCCTLLRASHLLSYTAFLGFPLAAGVGARCVLPFAYGLTAVLAARTPQAHSESCRLWTLLGATGITALLLGPPWACLMSLFTLLCPSSWLWWPRKGNMRSTSPELAGVSASVTAAGASSIAAAEAAYIEHKIGGQRATRSAVQRERTTWEAMSAQLQHEWMASHVPHLLQVRVAEEQRSPKRARCEEDVAQDVSNAVVPEVAATETVRGRGRGRGRPCMRPSNPGRSNRFKASGSSRGGTGAYRGEVASSYNTALLSPAARRDDAGSSATQNLQDDPEAHERSLVELGQNEDDKPGFDRKRRTGKVSTASVNRSCSDVVSSGCEQDR